jgi:hypothetical protein
LEVKQEIIMKKSLLLLFLGAGLVRVTAGTAFAQGNNLYLSSGTTTRTFNAGSGLGGPAKPAAFPGGSRAGAYPGAAANHQAHNGASQTTFNTGSATLAGAFTLLLLQRRYRNDRVLRPRS